MYSMRPAVSKTTDKGKGIQASPSDKYLQTVLGNLHFKPQPFLEQTNLERINFGKHSLIFFPPSNMSFRILPECVIDRPQRCLIDNLWISYNKKDTKYFIAALNALGQYFTDKNQDKRFKYYVVIHGKTKGIFQTWLEVLDSIKDIEKPLFKGFNDFTEALDYARGVLGPNYYITPALRQNPEKTPQYNIRKDDGKIIFCDHCSSMTEAFKRLNQKNDILTQENTKLIEQVKVLEHRIQALKFELTQSQTTSQTQIIPQPDSEMNSPKSSPSQTKMDETGVHSPMNAVRSTVSDNDTASPVQTVTGKDKSNPLMAVTLPKSEDEGPSRRRLPKTLTQGEMLKKKGVISKRKKNEKIEKIIKQTLENFFQEKEEQDKHIVKNPSLSPRSPSPSPRLNSGREQSSEETNDYLNYQDAQDPNDYDSGMSFDSEAIHNLDT